MYTGSELSVAGFVRFIAGLASDSITFQILGFDRSTDGLRVPPHLGLADEARVVQPNEEPPNG
jgi:hypothetical protein